MVPDISGKNKASIIVSHVAALDRYERRHARFRNPGLRFNN